MRQADLLVGTEEVHLVRARLGAPAQAVHPDLASGASSHHALATIDDGAAPLGIDGGEEQLRRAGGGVCLLIVMRLDDLDVPAVERRGSLGCNPSQHRHAERVVGRMNHRGNVTERTHARELRPVEARGSRDERGMSSSHVGLDVRERRPVGEVDREVSPRSQLVQVAGVRDVVAAEDLEAVVSLQGLADEGAHPAATDENDASQ